MICKLGNEGKASMHFPIHRVPFVLPVGIDVIVATASVILTVYIIPAAYVLVYGNRQNFRPNL